MRVRLNQKAVNMFERQTEKVTKHIHVGKYAANVEITHHYDGSGWEPTIDVEDVYKLERVRAALRAGDVAAAAREARVFELVPLAVQ
jgi:hypothetical protein